MKRTENNSEFLSEDLYQCSYLLTKGHKVLGCIRNGRKVAIRFIKTPALEKDAMAYYNTGKASASHLFASYRQLKDMIFQVVRTKDEAG